MLINYFVAVYFFSSFLATKTGFSFSDTLTSLFSALQLWLKFSMCCVWNAGKGYKLAISSVRGEQLKATTDILDCTEAKLTSYTMTFMTIFRISVFSLLETPMLHYWSNHYLLDGIIEVKSRQYCITTHDEIRAHTRTGHGSFECTTLAIRELLSFMRNTCEAFSSSSVETSLLRRTMRAMGRKSGATFHKAFSDSFHAMTWKSRRAKGRVNSIENKKNGDRVGVWERRTGWMNPVQQAVYALYSQTWWRHKSIRIVSNKPTISLLHSTSKLIREMWRWKKKNENGAAGRI